MDFQPTIGPVITLISCSWRIQCRTCFLLPEESLELYSGKAEGHLPLESHFHYNHSLDISWALARKLSPHLCAANNPVKKYYMHSFCFEKKHYVPVLSCFWGPFIDDGQHERLFVLLTIVALKKSPQLFYYIFLNSNIILKLLRKWEWTGSRFPT